MSATFEVTEHFPFPPEDVFRVMTDLGGVKEWMPGFVGIEVLTEGDFGVGTEWRETRKIFGKEATEHFEVTKCEAPSTLSIRVDGTKGASKKGEYLFDYELRPADGGTQLLLNGEISGLSGISALISRLMVGPFKKACAKDLLALREYLEGGHS